MNRTGILRALALAGLLLGGFLMTQEQTDAAPKARVFELRTYYTHPGKLPDLLARFRNHTTRLFEKHGMTNIGYWTPRESPGKENTLIYIVAHPSAEAATAAWKAFREDPEWIKVRDASEQNGKIVLKVESVFLDAVDFSKLK